MKEVRLDVAVDLWNQKSADLPQLPASGYKSFGIKDAIVTYGIL
jgi:hypothetical protein